MKLVNQSNEENIMKLHHITIALTTCICLFSISMNSIATNKNIVKKGVSKTIVKRSPKMPTLKEFKVNGIMAWAEAKKNGFQFYPIKTDGNKTGTGESGEAYHSPSTNKKRVCYKPKYNNSQMFGGVNMILNQCKTQLLIWGTYTYFHLFYGKKLKAGWKIKNMKFTGSYQWTDIKWKFNSTNIQTKIKMTNSKQQTKSSKSMLKEITLIGPANGKWQDAFDVN